MEKSNTYVFKKTFKPDKLYIFFQDIILGVKV